MSEVSDWNISGYLNEPFLKPGPISTIRRDEVRAMQEMQAAIARWILEPTFSGKTGFGDPGYEGGGINVNGTNYDAIVKINDYGPPQEAQLIMHRHSTLYPPNMIFARSNSDDYGHASVTVGQELSNTFFTGWTGAHYDIFGGIISRVAAGTISETSSPGQVEIWTTPDGSNSSLKGLQVNSDQSVTIFSATNVNLTGVSGALIIGGSGTSTHIAIDSGNIVAKADATTAGPLTLSGSAVNVDSDLSISFGGSAGIIDFRSWNSTDDPEIYSLLGSPTTGNGVIMDGPNYQHFVIGLNESGNDDYFAIISGGGDYMSDTTYDKLAFRLAPNGYAEFFNTVDIENTTGYTNTSLWFGPYGGLSASNAGLAIKNDAADDWAIILWDGVDSTGTLNIGAGTIAHNGATNLNGTVTINDSNLDMVADTGDSMKVSFGINTGNDYFYIAPPDGAGSIDFTKELRYRVSDGFWTVESTTLAVQTGDSPSFRTEVYGGSGTTAYSGILIEEISTGIARAYIEREANTTNDNGYLSIACRNRAGTTTLNYTQDTTNDRHQLQGGDVLVTESGADLILSNTDQRIFLGSNATGYSPAATSGVYFEGGKHALNVNDGGGNFNLRVANIFSTNTYCTEPGYASFWSFTQSTGEWRFQVSSASLSVGNQPTFWNTIVTQPTFTNLYSSGNLRLATNAGGITVTGDVTATDQAHIQNDIYGGYEGGTYANAQNFIRSYRAASNHYTQLLGHNAVDNTAVFNVVVSGTVRADIESNGDFASDTGNYSTGASDYAEYFEWADGNPLGEDRVGMTVVLVGEKIRLSTPGDSPDDIIGVVSAAPGVVGDAAKFGWKGRWAKDDFGRQLKRDVAFYSWVNDDGVPQGIRDDDPEFNITQIPDNAQVSNVQQPYFTDDYDPSAEYTPRQDRSEWAPIGLVGKLVIHDDQVTGTFWKRMKTAAPGLSLWLVR